MSTINIHITTVATATATSAVTGSSNLVWTTASVMTPVIVPGLAANKINGVSDRFWSPAALGTGAELPRNMENPIQASTPPPATEKASSDTPKTWSTLAPTSAAMTRMTSTANAALVASANRVAPV